MTRWMLVDVVLVVGVLGFAGCATGSDSDATVTVSAASSLTEAFEALADDYRNANPGARVELTFGSSSSLATQIEEGVGTDVFASADQDTMTRLVDAGLVSDPPVVLVRNQLAIAVKPGNPEAVRSLADLDRLDVVALCARDAPCGRFADRVLDDADVQLDDRQVTRAPNARSTLVAVADGDATAAIVYATDVAAATDEVAGVEIPAEANVVNDYPIAVLDGAEPRDQARELVEFLTSDRARSILARFGFLIPE